MRFAFWLVTAGIGAAWVALIGNVEVWSANVSDDTPAQGASAADLERGTRSAGRGTEEASVLPAARSAPGVSRNPGPAVLRRLTVPEYIETVRSAVGVDIAHDARRLLPPDVRADGFSNTAYNLTVDLANVEAYARLAEIIVGRMDVAKFAAEYSSLQELDDPNIREVIAGMGKWLLRGPLEERQIAAYLAVAHAVAEEEGTFHEVLSYIIEAMLQSPRFIYRVETEQGEGATRRVGNYELASRLSYILWGGPPDKELMRAADAGELSDRQRVAAQVQRMLEDPRAVDRSARFIDEWLNLDRLDNLRPNPNRFPNWNDQLAADMRDETLAFFREVAWEQQRPLWELLNAQVTFVTPLLANYYGLPRRSINTSDTRGLPGLLRAGSESRLKKDLLALYTFEEGGGETIRELSGAGEPLDLKIDTMSAVRWSGEGLSVDSSTLISTTAPPHRLIDAIQKANALTLEASITPADTRQNGPARILTLSADANGRNFTLGQDGDKYDVRLRTGGTSTNGLPSLGSPGKSVETRPTHVVYTRDAAGQARLYVNGEETGARHIGGDLSNWDPGFRLCLANEATKDRPWRGTFHRLAIYGRALSQDEIRSQREGMSRYDLASVPGRGGLLTHASVLTVGGDEASMVARGLFVLHELLDGAVEDPPPCVDTTPVPTKPGQSQRAIAEARLADRSCGGCHSKFEPLAFGLEKFDGLGGFHEIDEHGNKLRDDGELLFPGQDQPVAYRSSAELMNLLAGSQQVRKTMTRKAAQFALGRPLVETDVPLLDEIHVAAQQAGGTYSSLITAIVLSDLVQTTRTENDR